MNHFLKSFLLPLLICFGGSLLPVQAQKVKPSDYGIKSKKALKLYELGLEQEKYRSYGEASSYFKQALEIEPQFGKALYHAGACAFRTQAYEESIDYLDQARLVLHPTPLMLFFYRGECAFLQNEFQEALDNYEAFEANRGRKNVAKKILRDVEAHRKASVFALEHSTAAVPFEPVNLGENVNTPFDEYLPYLTADERIIFFTARRPGCIGGYRAEYRGYTEDFYYSVLQDGKWQPAENLGPPVNTENNEGAACFSPDGQYVYFTACNRRGGMGDCDLYVSQLDGLTWSQPRNLGKAINSSAWESQPSISHDGKTLYFASRRSGGLGGQDIWYSTFENGRWTPAQNLGTPVNSKGHEMAPFLHADGKTLYFSSDGHPGFGKQDLFMVQREGDSWSEPRNLGFPLNTSASEGNIFVNAKGNRGYINSYREGGQGRSDIYTFELDESIRPSYTTFVRGKIHEKGSPKALSGKVTFINIETGDTVRSVHSNQATGQFLVTLPLEQDYAAFVDKKGFLFASQDFSLKGLDPQTSLQEDRYFDVDIELQKLEVGISVVMQNIFYETNRYALLKNSKAELEHLVNFLKLNPKVKVEIAGHTDDVGSESDNKILSHNRAKAVQAYLVERGISSSRVLAKGYGEAHPIANNESEEGRALNRRTACRVVGL